MRLLEELVACAQCSKRCQRHHRRGALEADRESTRQRAHLRGRHPSSSDTFRSRGGAQQCAGATWSTLSGESSSSATIERFTALSSHEPGSHRCSSCSYTCPHLYGRARQERLSLARSRTRSTRPPASPPQSSLSRGIHRRGMTPAHRAGQGEEEGDKTKSGEVERKRRERSRRIVEVDDEGEGEGEGGDEERRRVGR